MTNEGHVLVSVLLHLLLQTKNRIFVVINIDIKSFISLFTSLPDHKKIRTKLLLASLVAWP